MPDPDLVQPTDNLPQEADTPPVEILQRFLDAHGFPATTAQIIKWRAAGAFPGPSRTYPGRHNGGGSSSDYGEAARLQLLVVASLERQGLRLPQIVMSMFMLGWPVEERHLHRDWPKVLGATLGPPRSLAAADAEEREYILQDRAEHLYRSFSGSDLVQHLLEGLEGHVGDRTPAEVLVDATAAELAAYWLGQLLPKTAAVDMLTAFGVGDAPPEVMTELVPVYRAYRLASSLEQMRKAVAADPLERLAAARDVAILIHRYASARTAVFAVVPLAAPPSPFPAFASIPISPLATSVLAAGILAASDIDETDLGAMRAQLYQDVLTWESAAGAVTSISPERRGAIARGEICWCEPLCGCGRARVCAALHQAGACCRNACQRKPEAVSA